MMGWKKKCLSFAGREVMIKAIVNAIPIYSMSCFKFPKGTCKELDSLASNFFWSSSSSPSSIHWRSWQSMVQSKKFGGLGFKDFEGFNDALLAKTAWRILQFPDARWVKILKSIYFPSQNFLHATRGHKASWGWDSILKGRDRLRKDLCWRVGSGHYIEVWRDPWIPGNSLSVLNKQGQAWSNESMLVVELIENGRWKLDPIIPVISEADAQKIREIPIPAYTKEDKLRWVGNKDGVFSVRKAYRLEMQRQLPVCPNKASSSFSVGGDLWQKLWQLNVIPRVKHFVWRAMNKALATMENLYQRKCSPHPLCPICNAEVESVEHALLLCPWVRATWFGCPLGLCVDHSCVKRIEIWFESLLNSSHQEAKATQALVANVLWYIWKARCKWVFENEPPNPWHVIETSTRLSLNFREANLREDPRDGRERSGDNVKWLRPPHGCIKVNCDGAFCEKTGRGGIGIVGRDWSGDFIRGWAQAIRAMSAFHAELLALLKAVEFAEFWGTSPVVIETDCRELYLAVQTRNSNKCDWRVQAVLEDVFFLLSSRSNISFSHTPRGGNLAADCIAALASREVEPTGLILVSPPSLASILAREKNSRMHFEVQPVLGENRKGIG